MNFLDGISIKSRLALLVLFIICILILFGAYCLHEMKNLGTLTSTLYNHPLRVSNAALEARNGIVRMHRDMKDVTLSTNEFELTEAIRSVQMEEQQVYEKLDVVHEYILGQEGKFLAENAWKTFADWKSIRLDVQGLIHEGHREEAAAITKGRGADHVRLLEHKMNALTAYARQKADGFMANAEYVQHDTRLNSILALGLLIAIMLAVSTAVIRHFLGELDQLQTEVGTITASGRLAKVTPVGNNEISSLAHGFNDLVDSLERQFWLREGMNTFNDILVGPDNLHTLADQALSFIARHTEACSGTIFLYDEARKESSILASYALSPDMHLASRFADGQGIVGQVARERESILLTDVSGEDAAMNSGTATTPAKEVYALPLTFGDSLLGVLEIASLSHLDEVTREFTTTAATSLASAMDSMTKREHIDALFEQTRSANEELEGKSDELRTANEQLAARNQELQAQSEELKSQARELKALADELTEQKGELELKRRQVEEADRLKSEFLSNMSHELRTPLNSILALSQLMRTKGTGKHPKKEAEYLKVMERNGRHLLALINDILDLSKIESGRMDLFATKFHPSVLVQEVVETMAPLAQKKGVSLAFDPGFDAIMVSDRDKIQQIILNLVSNAVKFTNSGSISIELAESDGQIDCTVTDTGIGIDAKHLNTIFDKFRQVDGTTTRRHEGSGLGLAICKQLAHLLAGDLLVNSEPGKGSTFTLRLPLHLDTPHMAMEQPPAAEFCNLDDYVETILVVDDDHEVRQIICEYLHQSGYRTVEAANGKDALKIAASQPLYAITLDIVMPEVDGWEVLRQLKDSDDTKDIPVIIVSIGNDQTTGMALGASGYVVKPVERRLLLNEVKRIEASMTVQAVLVVDDDAVVREQVTSILTDAGYLAYGAASGAEGLERAKALWPDAIILDLMMPEMDGFEVLEKLDEDPALSHLPVLVLTAKNLSARERETLSRRSRTVIRKGGMDLNDVFKKIERELAAIRAGQPPPPSSLGAPLVLVVEDNDIAALQISKVLEEINCAVRYAASGDEAIASVAKTIPDLVILDLMMPGVDGFGVLESIRSKPETAKLPVVVLTAKELTAADRSQLSQNNVRQFLRKGSLDRDQLRTIVLQALGEGHARIHDTPLLTPQDPAPPINLSEFDGTILLVEDNPDNVLTIRAVLDDFKGKLLVAPNGESGVSMAREARPDLVLMDIQLPDMSGLEATRLIKSDQNLANTPVIALTARAMTQDRDDILSAGCEDILIKPFDAHQLLTLAARWLGARKA